MSAPPVNDNASAPLADIMGEINALPVADVRLILATCMGRIHSEGGRVEMCRLMANVLATLGKPERKSMALITAEVAIRHGVSIAEMISNNNTTDRNPRLVRARQEAWWEIRQQRAEGNRPRFSLPQIGEYYGGRDHTTIISGIKHHEQRLQEVWK